MTRALGVLSILALVTSVGAAGLSAPAFATTRDTGATSDTAPRADIALTSDTGAAESGAELSTLEITDISDPVLEVGDDLTITVTYTNNGPEHVTITEFELFAQASTAISDTSVYYWMQGVTPATLVAATAADERVSAGATTDVTFTIPREELPWATSEFTWGPRGIEVRAVTDSDTVSDRTMIVAATDHPITPYPITAVVPATDPGVVELGTINDLLWHTPPADDEDQPEVAGHFFSDWDYPWITMIVDPALPYEPNRAERLSLPMYDADIAALAGAGRLAQAREFVDDSVFLPASAPSLDDLGFAADLDMTLLVPDALLPPVNSLTYTPGALTTISLPEETSAIATNSTMSSALAGQFTVGDFPLLALDPIDSRQVAVALSAVHHRQRPNDPRPVVVVVQRDAGESARGATLAVLDTPWVDATSLTQIEEGELSPVERRFIEPDATLQGAISGADLQRIDQGLSEFEQLAAIFEDGNELTAMAADRANRLLSVAWRSDPSGRNSHITGLAPTEDQRTAITINTSSTINMISESSALPIQVTNAFTEPVNVVVHLDTPDIRLVAPEPVAVRLAASTTSTVSVPVEARGSGNVDVEVFVTNEAGNLVGTPDTLHVRVRADWENVGTVIIAGVVAAVFLIGLIHSIRDGRRSDPIEPDDFVAASRR